MKNNNLEEAYKLLSAKLQIQNTATPLFGENPGGLLIFTENMRFNVVLHDLDVPKFRTEDRSLGSCEELKAAVKGALALYGTYSVDEHGDFTGQHVIGCTFPNWNGLERRSNELTLERKGGLLVEHLPLENDAFVLIEWQRIED
ncbi:lipocalin-like domain-containing protein [Flavobacterium alkalisoli]|nr:lipocalin-like domain-containing protein [Flavobacterium alkalisoli]